MSSTCKLNIAMCSQHPNINHKNDLHKLTLFLVICGFIKTQNQLLLTKSKVDQNMELRTASYNPTRRSRSSSQSTEDRKVTWVINKPAEIVKKTGEESDLRLQQHFENKKIAHRIADPCHQKPNNATD